jgi:RNA polymerase sigma-70 factor (ECF subfamily)
MSPGNNPSGISSSEPAEKPKLPADSGVNEDVGTIALNPDRLYAPASGNSEARQGRVNGALPASISNSEALPNDDAQLMLRVGAGDDAAFNYLVEKYRRPMVSFMYRMAHNQAVAEELAQEVFLRVYRSRANYQADAKFTTWLYRIATNLAANHARDTRAERTAATVNLDEPDEESGATPDVADARPTIEQEILREERLAAIRKHVTALPERQRLAVVMHKYQGMDYKQIGDVLKLSESATKSLLFRAYERLRERLQEFL